MALLNNGTIIAVAEEATIGAGKGSAWASTDVIPFKDDSSLAPSTEFTNRSNFNGSFFECLAVTGTESTSGNLNLELAIMPTQVTEAGKLVGHLLYKSALGVYVEQGADVNPLTGVISEEADPVANPTGYDLYRVSTPTEPRTTLAAREFIGGSEHVLDHLGIVINSVAFDFTAGQPVGVSMSAAGIAYVPSSGNTPLTSPNCTADIFVTKSATFRVDGVAVSAQNVSLTLNNTATDRMGIDSTGISDKVITKKDIELSYTLDMTDISAYTKLKNNTSGNISLVLTNVAGDEVYIYLPVVNYTAVDKSNDGGIITVNITSKAYGDANKVAMYMATQKA
jgi:hypothetical protein